MKKAKKLIKKVMAILLPSLLPLLAVVAIVSGLLAVISFVIGLIAGFLGLNHKEVDISNYTLEQIVEVVDDSDIVTEEMLDNMMIDRESLKKLLKGVQKANTEYDSREIKVQQKHEYLVVKEEEVKDADGNAVLNQDGEKTYIKSTEPAVDYDSYTTITVSNEGKESAYKLHWQQLYVFAVMRCIEQKNAEEITSGEVDGVSVDELNQAADDAQSEYDAQQAENEDTQSVSGQQICDYAMQFIGNPYVYGGTSLTSGCDCSGFIMSIYKNFGINTPRTSTEMRNFGYRVCDGLDLSLMQPGDVICYDGHVSLYIGNEQVISAASEDLGIIQTSVHYRKDYISVQRFVSETQTKEISKEKGDMVTTGVLSEFTSTYNPSTEWDDAFEKASKANKVPVGLLKAIAWEESKFDERAVSDYGAKGLMQLTQTGAGNGYTDEQLFDPLLSIQVGSQYIARKIEDYKGDVILGLTAYNQGKANVDKYLNEGTLDAKKLRYAAKVLNTYFGGIGLTGEKLASGNYTLYMNANSGVGVYDYDSGRLQLSSFDVDTLIDDFRASFVYDFDIVTDAKDSYTYDECKAMSGSYFNSSGKSSNTEEGGYTWYVPTSNLVQVMLPFEDIYFSDTDVTYSINNVRWYALMDIYWSSEYYDHDWLNELVAALPRGQEAIDEYDYYMGLAYDEFKKTGQIAKVLEGGSIGYYNPSSTNPYNVAEEYLNLGTDREWHMTKADRDLIYMSDAEIWNILVGGDFTRKPIPGETTDSYMSARTCTITIPVWKWSGKSGLKKKASKVTIRVNNAMAYTFAHLFKDIYEDPSCPVIKNIGSYNHRPVNLPSGKPSTTSMSSHSFGVAIDINANSTVTVGKTKYTNWNVSSSAQVEPTYSVWSTLKDTREKYELLYIDCPIVQVFKAYGFKWGEDYSKTKDGMHFSKVGDGTQAEGLANHLKYFK